MGDNTFNPARYVQGSGRKSPTNLGNVSQYPDDDGGYLRLKVRAYFAAGALALPGGGTSPPPPPPPPAPSFTLALSPTSKTIGKSQSGTFTVSMTAENGFASAVNLSAAVSPSLRGSMSFGSTSITSGSTNLVVSVSRNATSRNYTVTVTGVGGGLTRTATATVTVP
jgi:hypothetical protein